MKKYSIIFVILIATLLVGCSSYGYVSLNYPVKPVAYFPDKVSTIAVVNRSVSNAANSEGSTAESVLTGEIAGSDEKASAKCLTGVYEGINGKNGITVVIPKDVKLSGTGTRKVPEPLDWNTVTSICKPAKADLLLALEVFDSNANIKTSRVAGSVMGAVLGGIANIPIPRDVKINVMHLWKLYDPATKTVIDQYQGERIFNYTIGGDELSATAYDAGMEYILRYLPGQLLVKRKLYKKGSGAANQAFQTAFRRTQVANWEAAIQDWEKIVATGTVKNAGRACLNIAVANEVLGNTKEAVSWAKRSFEDFGEKLGRDYFNVLQERLSLEL